MQDPPAAADILSATITFLRTDALPKMEGRDLFQMRVAINALEMVRRELLLSPAADAAERERLAGLIGQDGELAALNAELCRMIEAGEVSEETPGLLAHLKATALAKIAVDQPTYAAYRRAMED
jgi:hypothetical protein